jgi:hypothetical protein
MISEIYSNLGMWLFDLMQIGKYASRFFKVGECMRNV